jgi:hypothetical protein
MLNPFHPDALDPIGKAITILKGDLPGHEFHGNQYLVIGSGSAAAKAQELDRVVGSDGGDGEDHSGDHDELSDKHYELSKDLARKADEATSPEQEQALSEASKAHFRAANAHDDASSAHEEVAGFQQSYGWVSGPNFEEPVQHAEATWEAAKASQKANELTQKALGA